jgi:hypothetical protein
MLRVFRAGRKRDPSSVFVALMPDIFGITPLGQHGGKRPGAGRPRKGEVRPPKQHTLNSRSSSSVDYIVARLARDAQDGCKAAAVLLDGVRSGLISAHTAGIEMSYCKRREVNGRGSENAARARDWRLHRLFNPHPQEKAPPGETNGA